MANFYSFLELIELLKNTERRGWVIRGVPNPESVADHMYRMAIMCQAAPGVQLPHTTSFSLANIC
jgi:5'-deoxynucleotidase YfbR-like HD superfamily hydrolase